MTIESNVKLTSSELGVLWSSYMSLAARLKVYEFIKEKTIDNEAKNILSSAYNELENVENQFGKILIDEGAVIPQAFNEQDVFKEAPALNDDIFHIRFLRQMMKIAMGFDAVYATITYKKEVQNVFMRHYEVLFKYYTITTDYLLTKGVYVKPPYVTMPKQAEFIEDKNYISGFNIFSDKRPLNTIEVGYIYDTLEVNIFMMKLLTGFAQVAKEIDIKKYFMEGIEMTKKNINKLSDLLLQSDIQSSSTWSGNVTDSKISPFSDKLMMFITSLLTTTPLSYTALGTAYNFRSDLPLTLGILAKDLFAFTKDGGKLMIKHKWMEEPPQMEDRKQLIKS